MRISISSNATSTLNDLDDKCVLEVFKHLCLTDLCSVADVSSRFRRNARTTFPHCVGAASFTFPLTFNMCEYNDSVDHAFSEKLSDLYKVLRLFGTSIETLDIQSNFNEENCDENLRSRYQRKAIELLIQYCSGTVSEMRISHGCKLSDENLFQMRPLLEGVQDLSYDGASETILKILPVLFTELKSLNLSNIPALNTENWLWKFSGFKKLDQIAFSRVHDMTNDRVIELLEQHPQLKGLTISSCPQIDHCIIQGLTQYGSGLEALVIETYLNKETPTTKYWLNPNGSIGKLNNLKYLKLDFGRASSTMEPVFRTFVERAQRALESLHLNDFGVCDPDHFVDSFLKLKKLKKLNLHSVIGLTAIEICHICKHLSSVYLNMDVKLTGENLLQLIQSAENLIYLEIRHDSGSKKLPNSGEFLEKIEINVDIFEEIVKSIEKRSWRTWIILDPSIYIANIPEDLTRAHKHRLFVKIGSMGCGTHNYPELQGLL